MSPPPRVLVPLVLACALPAQAQTARVDYEVTIEAPRAQRKLLEENLDLLRWRGNQQIDAIQLRRLYRAAPGQIRSILATQGYYSPTITPRIVPPPGWNAEQPETARNGTWRIEFGVDPGVQARVAEVKLQFRGFGLPEPPRASDGVAPPAPDNALTSALRESWTLPPGRPFAHEDWEAAKRALLGRALQVRYPVATLRDTTAIVDADANTVTLNVVLDSGPEVRFGALRVEGDRRYPAGVVANLSPIEPGDVYDAAQLRVLQNRLQETGYYTAVEVSTDLSDEAVATARATDAETLTAPVVVRVTETLRRKVQLGVGYSTNTGYRALAAYDDLKFRGLRLSTHLTLESKRQSARADVLLPPNPGGVVDSVGASLERKDIEGEITRLASLAAKRAWGTQETERSLSLEYLTEERHTPTQPRTRSSSLPLTYSVTFRRVNDLVFPVRGYVLNVQAGGAPLKLLTDRTFLRGYARGAWYRPLGDRVNLILRGELGAVASSGKSGIPSTFLFRAGGDQSVRGYAYQELGVQEGGAVVPGRYLATGSAEAVYWFLRNWGAAAFVDAGNAADSWRALKPEYGYGLGARWRSPVGPINADVAYGQKTGKIRLHFSLGLTF